MRKEHSEHVRRLIYEMELRNYSANTIRTYSELLSQIEKSLKIPLDKITTEQLKNHLHRRIKEDNVSVALVNQSISAWKILQDDVMKRDWEAVSIKRPRRVIKLPLVLSIEEVEQLIAATSNIKHRALLMLAYSSGLRRGEVQQIKPGPLTRPGCWFMWSREKGRKIVIPSFRPRRWKPSEHTFGWKGQRCTFLSLMANQGAFWQIKR